MPNIQTVLLIA